MDAARREFAARIHALATAHDAGEADRLDRFRILEPATAELRVADAGEALRGGLVAVDNVISHADQVEELLGLMAAEPGMTVTQVPVGAGLQLAVKR
jgi:hypothetical protein